MLPPEPGGGHEATGISRCSGWRGGCVAGGGAGAAGRARAACRRAHAALGAGRSGSAGPHRGVRCRRCSSWAGSTAATCGSTSALGAGQCRRTFANTRRNWSRSRRTSSWLMAARPWGRCCRRPAPCRSCLLSVADPVGAGFVESLARPGGNVTGFHAVRIQLEREMAGDAQADRAGRDARGGASGSRDHRRDRPVCRHPVRGAVARGGGEPDQLARRRRDRARRRGVRARSRMAA